LRWFGPLKVTLRALLSLMGDMETLALAQMQWLGKCPQPWQINSEVGDLAKDAPPGDKWFQFLRYDVRLEKKWIEVNLEQKVDERDVERFQRMDDPGIIKAIYDLACIAAKKQVHLNTCSRGARQGGRRRRTARIGPPPRYPRSGSIGRWR